MLSLVEGAVYAGRIELVRELGRGSHSRVWLARHPTPRGARSVAIKILAPQWYGRRGQEEAEARLRAEGRILFQLRHPSVVSILALIAGPTGPSLMLEYVEGCTLAVECMRRAVAGRSFSLSEIEWIVRQLTGAVYVAHQVGVVHRDLKPGNVMWLGNRVKLLDFGVAKLLDTHRSDETTVGRMIGSPFYMAPEQVGAVTVDGRADTFALGCVMFELLTMHRAWALEAIGHRARVGSPIPYQGVNAPHRVLQRLRSHPRPRPSVYRPELSDGVDRVIEKATHPDPAGRYESVLDFGVALAAALRRCRPVDGIVQPAHTVDDAAPTREVYVPVRNLV